MSASVARSLAWSWRTGLVRLSDPAPARDAHTAWSGAQPQILHGSAAGEMIKALSVCRYSKRGLKQAGALSAPAWSCVAPVARPGCPPLFNVHDDNRRRGNTRRHGRSRHNNSAPNPTRTKATDQHTHTGNHKGQTGFLVQPSMPPLPALTVRIDEALSSAQIAGR